MGLGIEGHEKGILCFEGEPGRKGARSFMASGCMRADGDVSGVVLLQSVCWVVCWCLSFCSHSLLSSRVQSGRAGVETPEAGGEREAGGRWRW